MANYCLYHFLEVAKRGGGGGGGQKLHPDISQLKYAEKSRMKELML